MISLEDPLEPNIFNHYSRALYYHLPELAMEDVPSPPSVHGHGYGEQGHQAVQGYQPVDHGGLGPVHDEPEQEEVDQQDQETSRHAKDISCKVPFFLLRLCIHISFRKKENNASFFFLNVMQRPLKNKVKQIFVFSVILHFA